MAALSVGLGMLKIYSHCLERIVKRLGRKSYITKFESQNVLPEPRLRARPNKIS